MPHVLTHVLCKDQEHDTCCICEAGCQQDCIDCSLEQQKAKGGSQKAHEAAVVGLSNTVVQPDAVVVEVLHTFVALAAVLAPGLHHYLRIMHCLTV